MNGVLAKYAALAMYFAFLLLKGLDGPSNGRNTIILIVYIEIQSQKVDKTEEEAYAVSFNVVV
ncbi:MAG: hypothetical protein Q4A67_04845 [Aerococcus sp.]|nr:hypothetical protein [Aerococcus sp.]